MKPVQHQKIKVTEEISEHLFGDVKNNVIQTQDFTNTKAEVVATCFAETTKYQRLGAVAACHRLRPATSIRSEYALSEFMIDPPQLHNV